MSEIMVPIVIIAVIIVAIIITWFAARNYERKQYDCKVGSAEEKSREIIDEALKIAETKKREALLEAKEESLKTKNELEKETKERRAELQRYEKRVLSKEENVEKKADALEKKEAEYGHPIYLISDEPYREIAFAGVEVPWIPHIYKDTIVCYSFSKSLSLPGERLGYVLVPGQVTDSKEVYAAVAGAGRSLGYVNAPSLFQQVTSLCCDMTSDLSVYEKNCELLVNSLREMGYHVAQPGGAFYLFPRSLEPDDMAFSERAKQFDLLLVPGSGFGAPGHFRLAYCVQTEMIQRALPKFKALADSYRG